eukprot:3485091-Pyramimonas_sp.AAC.1
MSLLSLAVLTTVGPCALPVGPLIVHARNCYLKFPVARNSCLQKKTTALALARLPLPPTGRNVARHT